MALHYRLKYKKYIGDIPKGYHVHHIDGNKENNKLINLIAIPASLHGKYHFLNDAIGDFTVKEIIETIYYSTEEIIQYENIYNKIMDIQQTVLNKIYEKNRDLFIAILNKEI